MSEEKTAREAMESSRLEVMQCEQEIQSIKNALKSLATSTGGATMNSLRVSVQKVSMPSSALDDDEDGTPARFKIHLSSPMEERLVTKLFDPIDPTAEGSFATFEQIEASNALVTVEAFSGSGGDDECGEGNKLGVSAAHDLLPLCEGAEKKTLVVEFAIVSEEGATVTAVTDTTEKKDVTADETDEGGDEAAKEGADDFEDAVEEIKETKSEKAEAAEEVKAEETENAESKDEDEEEAVETPVEEDKAKEEPSAESPTEEEAAETPSNEEAATAPADKTAEPPPVSETKLQLPICTLSIQLEYTPSPIDKRDFLYDQLNEVSKRKAAAIEKLRQSATAMSRAKATSANAEGGEEKGEKSQVVKAGFLNKPSAVVSGGAAPSQPPFWKRLYEKSLGPSSLLWVIGPVAKNYILFLGVSLLFHYKGDLLALPPPV